MTALTYLEWTGTVLQCVGCLIVALHLSWSGWAFPLMGLGSLAWLFVGLAKRNGALVCLNLFFTAVNVVGIWRWLG